MELEDEEGLCAPKNGQSPDKEQPADDIVSIDDDEEDEDDPPPPEVVSLPDSFDEDHPPEESMSFTEELPSEERLFPDEELPPEEEDEPQDSQPPDEERHLEEIPPEAQPEVVKKKRGKKKKPPVEEVFLPLPEEATKDFSPDVVDELQTAYNILQGIMRISSIQPFLDKPNENLFGMSSYYSIIKRPMWLNEVQRKLLSREYDSIASFVADLRLILENCYRFWGASHKFSRRALFIEHKLELKLEILPESLKEKCSAPELIADVVERNEVYDEYEKTRPKEIIPNSVNKGYKSKILEKIINDDPVDIEDSEEQNRREEEMLAWESEYLVSEDDRELIKSMWQLAEIGTFLKLTYEALNVEEITQYEVERMLLMPKESTTLANLMTSMLSPQVLRSQLDSKAVMPYEIWTFRLKKRIDHWFHVFYASDEFQKRNVIGGIVPPDFNNMRTRMKCDSLIVWYQFKNIHLLAFIECGVEPAFWTFVNITNPLDSSSFHEISFTQRVWIFKSLCDNLLHHDKPIQDCFYNSSAKELRPICIGRDKRNTMYFRIPFFQEIRVYKQTALPLTTFETIYKGNFYDDFLSEFIEGINEIVFNEDEGQLEMKPSTKDCYIIADSIESLKTFTKQLKDRKQLKLAQSFHRQLDLVKNDRKSIDGLIALHTQWHEYQNRTPEYFNHLLTLWLSAEKHKRKYDSYLNSGNGDEKREEVLGKRRRKECTTKVDYLAFKSSDDSNGDQSSNDYSSDVSDWETTYRKKKKKKQENMKKKRKRASSESNASDQEENCNEESNSTLSILGVQSIQDGFFEVEENPSIRDIIKQENHVDDCENVPIIPQTNMAGTNTNMSTCTNSYTNYPTPAQTPPITSAPPPANTTTPVIKKEKDDVICISSDEEEEANKNVSVSTGNENVLRNGLPPPKPAAPPATVAPPTTPPRRQSVPLPIPIQPIPQPMAVPVQVPQPKPVPQPMLMPQPIPATPPKKGAPLPKRRMPLPIPEPSWPQPIVAPPMPQPIMPQGWTGPRTPTQPVPPRTRLSSPRLRSPLAPSPVMRSPSPQVRTPPIRGGISPSRGSPIRSPVRNPAVRNLFPSSSVHTVEGVLGVGQKPDGSYGYHVTLPDGGIINMNRQEIDEIRRKNNGVLPVKIEVPLNRNKKF